MLTNQHRVQVTDSCDWLGFTESRKQILWGTQIMAIKLDDSVKLEKLYNVPKMGLTMGSLVLLFRGNRFSTE